MENNNRFFSFVLKYPEMVDCFTRNGETIEYVCGDIEKESLMQKIDEGFFPIITLERMRIALELFKFDKNVFKRFASLIEDYNKMQNNKCNFKNFIYEQRRNVRKN